MFAVEYQLDIFSDKIGRINTLACACILSIALVLLFLYNAGQGEVLTFYIGISIVGVCFGSFMGVFSWIYCRPIWEVKNNSVNYGIMFIGFALAGYFGPTIMNTVYNSNNSYQNAFIIAAAFSVGGLVLSFIYKGIAKKA